MKTMFYPVLLCLLICFNQNAAAQEQEPAFNTWMIAKDQFRYIFADTAFVRVNPDTKQAPVDTLLLGDEVKITGFTGKNLLLKRMDLPWLKVSYKKDGQDKEGYLWEGLISFTQIRRGDLKFVYAYDRIVDTLIEKQPHEQYVVKLKVVQAGKQLTGTSFKIFATESSSFASGRVMSGLGLSNVQHIVSLEFGGDACGVETNCFYFAMMKDGRLADLPGRMVVGDAGVYYHDESFVFPAEKNGEPDTIIMNLTEGEETEKMDKDGNPVMKETKSSMKYTWDGEKASFRKLSR